MRDRGRRNRLLAALPLALLASCHASLSSLNKRYLQARANLGSERYDLALPETEEGLALATRAGAAKDRWRFCLLKGDTLAGLRRNADALTWVKQCGELPQGRDWAEERAHQLLLEGRASSELNRIADAERLLGQAATAARETDSPSLSAEIEMRQGMVLLRQARFEEARQSFRHVVTRAAGVGDTHLEALALGNIGFAFLTESRNDEAIPWFKSAIAQFARTGADYSIASTHGNLGNCYFRLGDYDQARAEYQKAQDFFARAGNRENQQVWIGNGGNVAYDAGDYAAAEEAYRKALDMARQVGASVWAGRWLNNLAETSLQLGRWDDAEKYIRESLSPQRSSDPDWEPTFLVTEARIEEGRGRLEHARELFRTALSKRSEDPTVELDSHAGLARIWVRDGKVREADEEFRTTVGLIERRRAGLLKDDYKLPYLSSLIRFYQEYVDFLVSQKEPERALEVAESSRARVLESRLAGRDSDAGPRRRSADEYRRIARDMNAVILEYWLGARRSLLWVITPGAIRLLELPSRSELHKLIENYQQVIAASRNPLDAAGETGQKLYSALLGPVAEARAPGRFLIVPDQDLYSLNPETLPDPGNPRAFWIENATVSIAPSLNLLAVSAQSKVRAPAKNLLAIGDAPGEGEYPHLEYAAQEINSVTEALGRDRAVILSGADATPAAWVGAMPARFSFIHFAAHAAANYRNPLDSAVILAGPPDNDRLLARTVMESPLNAELVTISACRSAGGRAYAGEGLVGFAWAFLRAGAHNVIAGLWDVNDRSSSETMTSLYRRIAAGEDFAGALRDAKLELIRRGGAYVKPFYWAPFQLYQNGTVRRN